MSGPWNGFKPMRLSDGELDALRDDMMKSYLWMMAALRGQRAAAAASSEAVLRSADGESDRGHGDPALPRTSSLIDIATPGCNRPQKML